MMNVTAPQRSSKRDHLLDPASVAAAKAAAGIAAPISNTALAEMLSRSNTSEPVSAAGILFRLPLDPTGLPPEWTHDPTHLDPNGTRWRHPNGDYLDFHKGRPGQRGFRGRDHWHHNGEDEHLIPGEDEIGEPEPVSRPAEPGKERDPVESDAAEAEPETHERTNTSTDDKTIRERIAAITGLTGTALTIYLILSEGSRAFPPRNLIPLP
jgi:hypothetical protein